MPTMLTFTSLQSDIRAYLERGNVSDTKVYNQLPRIINQAERAISTQLKIEGFLNVVTADLLGSVGVYAKPDRWRKTVSMYRGVTATVGQDRQPIFPRSYEYCRSYWPNPAVLGTPLFYADYNYSHWIIVPTPQLTEPWEIIFYQMPALLDDSNQTNWLTDYAPNALLYRALLECEPFLKNDERIGTWRGFYDEAIGSLNLEDLQKVLDRSSVREGA